MSLPSLNHHSSSSLSSSKFQSPFVATSPPVPVSMKQVLPSRSPTKIVDSPLPSPGRNPLSKRDPSTHSKASASHHIRSRAIYSIRELLGTEETYSNNVDGCYRSDDDTLSCDSQSVFKTPSAITTASLRSSQSNSHANGRKQNGELSPLTRSAPSNSSMLEKEQQFVRALLLHTSPLRSPRAAERMRQFEQILDQHESEQLQGVMNSITFSLESSQDNDHHSTGEVRHPCIVSKTPFGGGSNGANMEADVPCNDEKQQQHVRKISAFDSAAKVSFFMNRLDEESYHAEQKVQQKQQALKVQRLVQHFMQYLAYHCDNSQGKIVLHQLVSVLVTPPEEKLQEYYLRMHKLQLHWQRQHIPSFYLSQQQQPQQQQPQPQQHPSFASTAHSISPIASPHHPLSPTTPSSRPLHGEHRFTFLPTLPAGTTISGAGAQSSCTGRYPLKPSGASRRHLHVTADPSLVAHMPNKSELGDHKHPAASFSANSFYAVNALTSKVIDFVHNSALFWSKSPLKLLYEMIMHNREHREASITHWFDSLIPPFALKDEQYPHAEATTLASFVNAISVLSTSYFARNSIGQQSSSESTESAEKQVPVWSNLDIIMMFFLITLPHYSNYHIVYEALLEKLIPLAHIMPFGFHIELYSVEEYRRMKLDDAVTCFLAEHGRALTMSRFACVYAFSTTTSSTSFPCASAPSSTEDTDIHSQLLFLVHSRALHRMPAFQRHYSHVLASCSPSSGPDSAVEPDGKQPTRNSMVADVSPLAQLCPAVQYLWEVAVLQHEIGGSAWHHDHADEDGATTAAAAAEEADVVDHHHHLYIGHGRGGAVQDHPTFVQRLHVTRQLRRLARVLLPAASSSSSSSLASASATSSKDANKDVSSIDSQQVQSQLLAFVHKQYLRRHPSTTTTTSSALSSSSLSSSSLSTTTAPSATNATASSSSSSSSMLLLSMQSDVTVLLTSLCARYLQQQQSHQQILSTAASLTHHHHHQQQHHHQHHHQQHQQQHHHHPSSNVPPTAAAWTMPTAAPPPSVAPSDPFHAIVTSKCLPTLSGPSHDEGHGCGSLVGAMSGAPPPSKRLAPPSNSSLSNAAVCSPPLAARKNTTDCIEYQQLSGEDKTMWLLKHSPFCTKS